MQLLKSFNECDDRLKPARSQWFTQL